MPRNNKSRKKRSKGGTGGTREEQTAGKKTELAATSAAVISPPPKPKIYVSKPLKFQIKNPEALDSAELDFYGIDHSSGSFEARVFLNNQSANHDTKPAAENGYAGSFFIFGHGGCYGDVGHCEVRGTKGPFDLRFEHPLTPGFRYLEITQKLKDIARTSAKEEIVVTVVPVIHAYNEMCKDLENILKFERLTLLTHEK